MRGRWTLAIAVLLCLIPAIAHAEKCTRVLPGEVFAFFGDSRSDADCADYEYKLIDLNDDEQLEIYATNYRRSCEDIGFCNFEFFEKREKVWVHIATIPGRVRTLQTKTKGYHDIATWLLGQRYIYVWNGKTFHDIMRPENNATDPTPETPENAVKPTPSPTPQPTTEQADEDETTPEAPNTN